MNTGRRLRMTVQRSASSSRSSQAPSAAAFERAAQSGPVSSWPVSTHWYKPSSTVSASGQALHSHPHAFVWAAGLFLTGALVTVLLYCARTQNDTPHSSDLISRAAGHPGRPTA
ncbi:hypothetical protein, partial [Streptomyces sp. NPDC047065]|uniref:hypothetical protein n=1 Tax=Streptomyces sp. NPDC047065 TaxID=3154606 RepID=UPI0034052E3D